MKQRDPHQWRIQGTAD